VRFTAHKGHSGLGSLSITTEMVALIYPVAKRLMTTCSRLVIVLVFHYVMWFAFFHGCARVFPFFLHVVFVRVFLLSITSSRVEDMFRCGEFIRSVLLLLHRPLNRFQISLRDSEPIVM
jgi:hypothetical protein